MLGLNCTGTCSGVWVVAQTDVLIMTTAKNLITLKLIYSKKPYRPNHIHERMMMNVLTAKPPLSCALQANTFLQQSRIKPF